MTPKVIVITGASRGIGLAVARFLLRAPQSHNVVVVARSREPLESLKSQYPTQVQVVCGDLSDSATVKEAVELALETWGRLDSLVLNHGILEAKRVEDHEIEAWRRTFDVNYFSVVEFVKEALCHLRRWRGNIIITSSGAVTTGYATWGAYGASKAAINHLVLTLSNEEKLVTSISIRPGVVDTEMQREIREFHSTAMDQKDAERFRTLKEQGGLLKPEQPGHVIAKLAVGAPQELSGKFLSWNDPALAAFQD
ncbi:hypothetical protein FGG08_001998 [Glutinoglossum americanum]|uniref:Ketoreductase domain-containing protein n=1 Tax=Glutinoglossum americanum TaxID=1670608 RepID=A0A9P8IA58_9PEZI|nr:hypothetical protein FGG08_001998 [Glutinoglossum americanum]